MLVFALFSKQSCQDNALVIYGNQHKSRQVQKATGINVGREKNKIRHAQIIISANREHQAQENVYTAVGKIQRVFSPYLPIVMSGL